MSKTLPSEVSILAQFKGLLKMPTPPPPPVPEPQTEEERQEREQCAQEIDKFLERLDGFLYAFRSHIPCGHDYTDMTTGLNKLREIAKERPDWVARAMPSSEYHKY